MRILFICHGNICRSPMAEYIMKELVKREGVASDWEIESAAVSREEIGDPDGKLHLLLDFTDRKGEEVADPWYTGDFDAVWEDLLEGCQALLREYR